MRRILISVLDLIKQGNGIKCLFPLLFALVLILQFFEKRRKTFPIHRSVMIFNAKVQIISKPFHVTKMGCWSHALLPKRRIIYDPDIRGDGFHVTILKTI